MKEHTGRSSKIPQLDTSMRWHPEAKTRPEPPEGQGGVSYNLGVSNSTPMGPRQEASRRMPLQEGLGRDPLGEFVEAGFLGGI